jgi:hypothetical protein
VRIIDKRIDISPSERETMLEKIISFKTKDGVPANMSIEDITREANRIIDRACNGWTTASSIFENRITILLGLNPDWSYKDKGSGRKRKQTGVLTEEEAAIVVTDKDLLEGLNKKERLFFKNRMEEYNREFGLNNSSDHSLILQIIAEEIRQRRLIKESVTDITKNYDRELNASIKRMTDSLNALGITRAQRQEANTEIDGNVAQLALELERKFMRCAKESEKLIQEEIEYLERHNDRSGPKNRVPSEKEIEEVEKSFGLA